MSFIKSLTWLELSFIGLFAFAYLLYLLRTSSIARRFNTHSLSVSKKLILRSLYFSLLIIAILGPSFGETKKEIKAVGKDIYVAVDLSLSMNAEDIPPSRLDKIKFELKNFVDAFKADRLGLIIFSSEAFVQCPLTYDQNALSLFIETLSSTLVPNAGTNISAPLELAMEKHLDEKNSTTSKQSKVIVLISDGEDFEGDLEDIGKEISDNGIKVFALGVGTDKGSKIPYNNSFKTNRKGEVVITKLNEESLKKVAYLSDGNYYRLDDEVNEMEKMINDISKIEGDLRDIRNIDASANKYHYFLLVALFLACFDLMFTVKTFRI